MPNRKPKIPQVPRDLPAIPRTVTDQEELRTLRNACAAAEIAMDEALAQERLAQAQRLIANQAAMHYLRLWEEHTQLTLWR